MSKLLFVDRRKGNDRRDEFDPCKDLVFDLYHRKRRKSYDRRTPSRTILDDYYAYITQSLSLDEIQSHQYSPIN